MFKIYHPSNLDVPVIEADTQAEAIDQAHQMYPNQITLICQDSATPNAASYVGPIPGDGAVAYNNNHALLKKIKGIYNHSR